MDEEEMTPQQKAAETKRKRTRDWIITSTLDLYGDQEQGDFTREQIAEAAGVGLTTLSNHFRLKWEVLRAAHERLLAPITQPIVRGYEDGTYHPADGVRELLRYVYSIAKLSHEHRALTVAMIRAYFETPPENREELLAYDLYQRHRDRLLAGHIVEGLYPITMQPPFENEGKISKHALSNRFLGGTGTFNYHSTALLMELYHRPLYPGSPPEEVTNGLVKITSTVCAEFLAVMLPDEARRSMLDQVRDVAAKVDEQFEQWKRRDEMQGWS